ncbi:glycosyltransferase [Weissella koreensis]|uniref:glycosyltransferase family 2 protein n=1 Tax=Weissella koreensis TaxID=165096 RepID=UPI0022BA4ADA|nr:glycosyltransferase [Weissella koreensis]MCZ9311088.1 glycosyltransferase [Weissella koreensis]
MSIYKKIKYFLAIFLTVVYLIWRLFFTIPWHASIFTLTFAILLVSSELLSSLTAFLLIIFRLMQKRSEKNSNIPEFDLSQPVPGIDVIIVTHNEEVNLLRKTVNASKFMEYPEPNLVNIVIADDGNRSEVKALADEYQVQYITMENNTGAKAGNINNALKQLDAPLITIFDADMIPYSNFLLSSVPFFTKNFADLKNDPENTKPLGFIQTPQSFYNADIFQFNLFLQDSVVNEQDYFSRDVNVLNGANGHALFTGSNAVFLREIVDRVGLFPTDTITEDFELGTRINSEGYMSIATDVPVSSGITPVDMKSVIKQRVRWARGVIQSCKNMHIFTNPKITFLNRIILINTWLYWWSFARRLIFIIAPILYALFHVQVVYADFWLLMVLWAPGYLLLHSVLGDTSTNIRNERWGEIQETFFAPYIFIPVIMETIGLRATKFKVTDKNVSFSWKDKLYTIPYLILWVLILISIISFNYGKWGSEILYGSVITFWLLMHFINLSFCVFISMKRNINRKSERFMRKTTGKIKLGSEWVPFKTRDVSDAGFSMELSDNHSKYLLQPGQRVEGTLDHKEYKIHFKSSVMRVNDQGSIPWYGLSTEIDQTEDLNHYLELIYDGQNKFVAGEQDNWITTLDELNLNIILHLKAFERSFMKKFIKNNINIEE